MDLTDLRYPAGKFFYDEKIAKQKRDFLITEIEETPANVINAVQGLTDEKLNIPYRPGGWTIKQVVHHIPESHMNAYIRFKLTLTEEMPLVKSYDEARWAELNDINIAPIEVSLNLLVQLHKRWVMLLRSLNGNDFNKQYKHPELGVLDLNWAVAQYAWHGRHHTAHITSLRERMGW